MPSSCVGFLYAYLRMSRFLDRKQGDETYSELNGSKYDRVCLEGGSTSLEKGLMPLVNNEYDLECHQNDRFQITLTSPYRFGVDTDSGHIILLYCKLCFFINRLKLK
jgi:hypothetical protein